MIARANQSAKALILSVSTIILSVWSSKEVYSAGESRCQTRRKSDGMLGESGDSERVEGTVLDICNIDRATKMAKHVLVSQYTLYCVDVAVVDFGGTADELLETLEGGTDESDALCEKVSEFWVEYDKNQKCGAEWSVDKYEDWSGYCVEDPKEGDKKISELPVHKVVIPVFS